MASALDKKKKVVDLKSLRATPVGQQDALSDFFFFNRFGLEVVDGFSLLYFGTVVRSELLSTRIIAISEADVKYAYTLSKAYIAALGSLSLDPPAEWNLPRTKNPVLVSNMMLCSMAGEVGEFVFSNFTIHDMASVRQGDIQTLYARRTLALRGPLALQRQVLGNLFKGIEA